MNKIEKAQYEEYCEAKREINEKPLSIKNWRELNQIGNTGYNHVE